MVVAGLDISTFNIDVVLLDLDTDHAEWNRYTLEGADLIDRVRASQGFRHWRPWQWEDCIAAGIERPVGKHGVAQVSMVFGAVLASLPHRLLVQPWQPASWRRAIGLKGNASKDDIARWACARSGWQPSHGPDGVPQDGLDAYAIAYATRQAIEVVDSLAESIIAPGNRHPQEAR